MHRLLLLKRKKPLRIITPGRTHGGTQGVTQKEKERELTCLD